MTYAALDALVLIKIYDLIQEKGRECSINFEEIALSYKS